MYGDNSWNHKTATPPSAFRKFTQNHRGSPLFSRWYHLVISPNQCGFPTDYGWSKANFCSCNKQCCYLYLHLLLLKITSQKVLLRSRFASDRNPTLGKFRSLAARIIKFVASITILCCSNHQVRWFNVSLLLLEGLSLPVKNLQLLLQFSKNQPFSLEYPMQISKKNRLNLPVFTGKSIFLNISSMIFPGVLHLGASNCPGPRASSSLHWVLWVELVEGQDSSDSYARWCWRSPKWGIYILVMTNIAIENCPFIVDLPIHSMVIFHRFLYVYQRVSEDFTKQNDGFYGIWSGLMMGLNGGVIGLHQQKW